jgi:CDP-diacylglycerol--glycerol-3-phosphate 3-phosphatidyltransferase
MFNLPNKITLFRIVLVPLIVVLLYFEGRTTCMLAMLSFAVAAVTDLLDGHIARRSGLVTSFGKFLDPLADKVLVSSVLIMMVELEWIAAWIAIVIICRDIMITGLRAIAADEGVVIAADTFGKMKTVLQMVALLPLLLHYPFAGFDPVPVGRFLLYIALILTIFSGANYLYRFYRLWTVQQSLKDAAG